MPAKEPEKLYYSIGEVSRLTQLPASVLRYWETEFSDLHPPKNRAGKRVYRRKDIDRVLLIKKLLYDERFTIEGARKLLAEKKLIVPEAELSSTLAPSPAPIGRQMPCLKWIHCRQLQPGLRIFPAPPLGRMVGLRRSCVRGRLSRPIIMKTSSSTSQ